MSHANALPRASVPHQAALKASHALLDVSPLASHQELTDLAANYCWLLSKSLALSPSVAKSLSLQMIEVMDAIDQDLVNQQAEQAWREQESRNAGFVVPQVVRDFANGIAAVNPLEIRA
jgi:hypothetical protein